MFVMFTNLVMFHHVTADGLRASLGKPIDVTVVFADSVELVSIFRTEGYQGV